MLDIKFITENAELVKQACNQKHEPNYVDEIVELVNKRKATVTQRDQLRQKLNDVSSKVAEIAKQKGDVAQIKKDAKGISDNVKSLEDELRNIEEKLNTLALRVPNIPHESVPIGKNADDNAIIRHWGEPREFSFAPKDHLELNEKLGMIDFESGAKVAGSFFPTYTGDGARLLRSLISFMIDVHTLSGKYREAIPPFLANRETLTGTAQLPKLEEDMYHLDQEDLFLIPTSEVQLINIFRGETLQEDNLPIYICGYSACFRREAGTYGKETRGLMRLHQFDKVELVKIAHPEKSWEEHEDMLTDAEKILQLLGLHYRVILLCTGDMTFASAKTYDIEVWAPGTNKWLEVSSVSNTTDFQARRMNTRFRSAQDGKLHFVHTLNGSGVALPRLIIALMENYQNADGTIIVPDVIQRYFGKEKIML